MNRFLYPAILVAVRVRPFVPSAGDDVPPAESVAAQATQGAVMSMIDPAKILI